MNSITELFPSLHWYFNTQLYKLKLSDAEMNLIDRPCRILYKIRQGNIVLYHILNSILNGTLVFYIKAGNCHASHDTFQTYFSPLQCLAKVFIPLAIFSYFVALQPLNVCLFLFNVMDIHKIVQIGEVK